MRGAGVRASALMVALTLAVDPAGASPPIGSSLRSPSVGGSAREAWARRHEGPVTLGTGARAVGVSPDGSRVFVTGGAAEQGLEQLVGDVLVLHFTTVAYDATRGDVLWEATYRGPAGFDEARSLAVSPDGSTVYVTGYSRRGDQPVIADYATVAYDAATGEERWTRRHAAGGEGAAFSVGVSPDGAHVFVTGVGHTARAGYDYVTVAYSAARGDVLWVQRFGGSGTDAARSLAVSPDGATVVVTGSSQPGARSDDRDYATVAYRTRDGRRLWTTRYQPLRGYAESVVVSADGATVFVTGWTPDPRPQQRSRFTTVAYRSTSGRQVWVAHHLSASSAYAEDVAVSPDGSAVFVTGWTMHDAENWDYGTVAYRASTGARLWSARYDSGRFDGASSAVVSPDGSTVYVTGGSESTSGTRTDSATVAYRASDGELQWVARHDSRRGNDWSTDIAVSPDGSRVFVTGATDTVLNQATSGGVNQSSFDTVAYWTG